MIQYSGHTASQCLGTSDIESKVPDRPTTNDIWWECKPARVLRDMQTVLGERERVGRTVLLADAAAACCRKACPNR